MLSSLSVEVLCLATIVLSVAYVLHSYCFDPLSSVPKLHWSAPLSRVYYLSTIYKNSRRQVLFNAHTGHGGQHSFCPVIRVGPNEVSVMSTGGAKTILSSSFERGSWYDAFKNFGTPNMFSFQSAEAHVARRSVFAKDYSKTAISKMQVQSLIRRRVTRMQEYLESRSRRVHEARTGPVVVRDMFRALQADVLTAFAFSEAHGTNYLQNMKQSEELSVKALGMQDINLFLEDSRGEYFFWESEAPFKAFSHLIAPQSSKAHNDAEKWIASLISEYESRFLEISCPLEKQHFLENGIYGKLLAWQDRRSATKLAWEDRASEIMDHVGAGQDSVPMVLEFILRKLSLDARLQTRLRAEILESLPNEYQKSSFSMIDMLPFLNAVVLEGLRLVDTVESCQTRVVPRDGCVVEGYHISAGTIVSAQPYLVHRQESVFPDPETFNPNRWLINNEKYGALHKNLLTFSIGPRACIGKELALAVIKTSLSSIYRDFSTKILAGSLPKEGSEGHQAAEIEFQCLTT